MAVVHLALKFWRSRFEYPHEMCHIDLRKRVKGVWDTFALCDWRDYYCRLLKKLMSDWDWWENRRRISGMNMKLVEVLLSEQTTKGA